MHQFVEWLSGTSLSATIQQVLWLIPVLQTVHILAIAVVISSVFMVALRIFGAARSQSMAQIAHRFVPWLWTGLVVLALTGATLIVGEPKRSLLNPAFQIKMALLAIAIAVTAAFQVSLRDDGAFWNDSGRKGTMRACALATFVLWCAIAVAGRWIAYVKVT